ncbi:YihY/virulence factor BrkB family protein [Mycolicibacterium thermoresistibile]
MFRTARATVVRRIRSLYARTPTPLRHAWRLTDRTIRESMADRVPGLAAEAALFTLISLPALMLAVFGSLGFIAEALGPEGTAGLRRLVLDVPQSFLTDQTFRAYERIVEDVLTTRRGSVISIGLLLSLWTGSRAVNRYLETITIAYGVAPRPIWRQRLIALGLTAAGLLGAAAVLPPLVVGPQLIEQLTPPAVQTATTQALDLLFWPALILAILVGLVSLYHFGVPWKTPWRRDLPGAILAMLLWLLASAGLRAYLAVSMRDDAVYAQLAVPIAVVLWLYVTAFAVLVGAEFNAEIERTWPHERYPWRLRRRRDRPSADESARMKP